MFLLNYFKSFGSNQIEDKEINTEESSDDEIDEETIITNTATPINTNLVFPNYVLIKILNYLIINDFGTTIVLDYDYANPFCFNNFLKLSIVSKAWEKNVIPHLNYQMVKIRFKRDVVQISKLIQKGVNKYPLINLNKVDVDFPNLISPEQMLEIKQLTQLTNIGHKFEKVRLTSAIAPKEDQIEIPTILTDFILLNGVSDLELYMLPAIRYNNYHSDPNIKYTNIIQYCRLNDSACNIEHLILKNQLLPCERIMDLIDLFPRLVTLDLSNNRIGIDYSSAFTYAISTAVRLTSFKIASNVLKSNLNELLPSLTNLPHCNTLDISENYCDDSCSKEIASLISTNKSITSLNISSNLFKQLGINEIMSSLIENNGILVELILSNFQIFNTSLLGDYLTSNVASLNLKHLNLSNSNISGGPASTILKSIYNSFKNGNINSKSLISFDASNCKLSHEIELELLSSVLTNCNISKIKLSRVFRDSVPCKLLFSNLSSSITDLDISMNIIYQPNIIELSDILSTNKSIVKLNLTGNGINNTNVQHIFNSLSTNSTLTNLNLSGNSISLFEVDYMFLKLNKSLITLDLSLNSIENQGMIELFRAFKLNSSVTHLNIENNKLIPSSMVFPNISKRKPKFQEIKTNLSFKNHPTLHKVSKNIQYDSHEYYQVTRYLIDDNTVIQKNLNPRKRMAY